MPGWAECAESVEEALARLDAESKANKAQRDKELELRETAPPPQPKVRKHLSKIMTFSQINIKISLFCICAGPFSGRLE